MIKVKRSVFLGALLVGLVSGATFLASGCSNQEPVMTEAAKEAERKQMEDLTKANDEASKAASRPSNAKRGMMPP